MLKVYYYVSLFNCNIHFWKVRLLICVLNLFNTYMFVFFQQMTNTNNETNKHMKNRYWSRHIKKLGRKADRCNYFDWNKVNSYTIHTNQTNINAFCLSFSTLGSYLWVIAFIQKQHWSTIYPIFPRSSIKMQMHIRYTWIYVLSVFSYYSNVSVNVDNTQTINQSLILILLI